MAEHWKQTKKLLYLILEKGYFDDTVMTNIIGLKHICSKYWVTYNSKDEPAFKVYKTQGGIIK